MTVIPLVRLLTDAGYGSRRESSKLVKAGLVEVNGEIASSYTEKVDPEVDSIVVTGTEVPAGTTRRVYIVLNKPEGYLSTTEDDRDRPTVLELLPERLRLAGLHPAGRLDEDSTGLLILTNDGQLTYELTHPRFEHEKEYWVATTGRLTDADVERLEKGVEIEEQMTRPARIKLLLGQSPYTYSITIHEGRKRQVRMMFAAIGQQVALLRRVRVGGLLLGDLKESEWRELTPPELKDLMRKRPPQHRTSGADDSTRPPRERSAHTDDRQAAAPAYTVDRPPRTRSPYTERTALRTGTERRFPAGSRDEQATYGRHETGQSGERPYRESADTRNQRSYTRRESAPAAGRAYARPADERGPRAFVQRESYAPTERREGRPAPGRDARPYARRDSGASPERPYRRSADDRPPRTFGQRESYGPPERRESRPAPGRDARPYARRESGPAPERPYRRPADDRGPRTYERSESHGPSERRERRPSGDRDTRPFARRDSGPATERPYRRPTEGRGPHSYNRSESHATPERRERRPSGDRDARPFARPDSGPATERPYRRPAEGRSPRTYGQRDSFASPDRRESRPPQDRGARHTSERPSTAGPRRPPRTPESRPHTARDASRRPRSYRE